MSMARGTGGNRFIAENANIPALMRVIHESLYELAEYDEERPLDLSKVTITTERMPNGTISVEVAADLPSAEECLLESFPGERSGLVACSRTKCLFERTVSGDAWDLAKDSSYDVCVKEK